MFYVVFLLLFFFWGGRGGVGGVPFFFSLFFMFGHSLISIKRRLSILTIVLYISPLYNRSIIEVTNYSEKEIYFTHLDTNSRTCTTMI